MLDALERSGIGNTPNEGGKDKEEDAFDLLIVGGGATGAGVAVDAASRGLRVALVERDDFSSGTSRRQPFVSTHEVEIGVRDGAMQARRPSRPSSFMVVYVTCKRQ